MPIVFPTATLGSRDSEQVFPYMLVHCKYTRIFFPTTFVSLIPIGCLLNMLIFAHVRWAVLHAFRAHPVHAAICSFFFFFPWLMKGRNSVACVHVGLCGWLVHSFAKAAAVLCMLLLLLQAQFLEEVWLWVVNALCSSGVLKSNYVGAVKELAHYISLMVAVQQQDLVYFTASTSTTARAREWVGELFHAEGMHKKARVFWYWSMVFLHCSASSRVPIVTANAGARSWTGSDRSRSAFCYKPFL